MNITEAKEQIQNAMRAYFTKDTFGNYRIPVERQRPLFLMGPPGVGKTAIMEQVAAELGVSLVSYSMTHHTRQSALGLPFIEKKHYDGGEYSVSEYTMSEIIASVYEIMEQTSIKEGILFLDEINCVSETLAPAMLQFLQYKTFGRHRVPDGWIVVTAGNPPEYNNSVREFDIVTWDRLKRIDIEPDFDAWKAYAYKKGIHAAILTYLNIKKGDFYKIESTVDGTSFVTARGWMDLSDMMQLYELNGILVDEKLIGQYLQDRRIAKEFAAYYDLFNQYKSDYQIGQILDGKASKSIKERAKTAKFDERLSLLGLLLAGVMEYLRNICLTERMITELLGACRVVKTNLSHLNIKCALDKQIEQINDSTQKGRLASSMSEDVEYAHYHAAAVLNEMKKRIAGKSPIDSVEAFQLIKEEFDQQTKECKKQVEDAGIRLSQVFTFCEEVFGDGQEMQILVSELNISYYGMHFISRHGCKEYVAHSTGQRVDGYQDENFIGIEDIEL